jgi:hypothetical protein
LKTRGIILKSDEAARDQGGNLIVSGGAMIKRIFALILSLACLFCFAACNDGDADNSDGTTHTEATEKDTAELNCEHEYEEEILSEPEEFKGGLVKKTCKLCGKVKEEAIPATKTLKILAIGNSFSVDAMAYLWKICDSAGYGEVVLGNLFIGGCTLEMHWENISTNAPAYIYYKTDENGEWKTNPDTAVETALLDEEWDIITLQQASGSSGLSGTYVHLQRILDYIESKSTNDNAEVYWHMTWAYQGDSGHGEFAKYDHDQKLMYESIANSVSSQVLPRRDIKGVIPVGTVIQNLRTSHVGDTLTRDGYHLNCDVARYAAALTWYRSLTGLPLEQVNFVPKTKDYPEMKQDIDRKTLETIYAAVEAALETPLEVTDMSK